VKPILPGGRGSAVEDIQRRLLRLGYDLGPTGVDGVFLGRTREAVEAFQRTHGLSEDGVVGNETWAALVDATFTLGDRMLYLRVPYLHGNDVRVLQEALNVLGFWAGDLDGIFGPYAERAVREFQRSSGHPDDGIAGLETVRALMSLRHVWEGKDSRTPAAAVGSPARGAEVLARFDICLEAGDLEAREVCERVVNLAAAAHAASRVRLAADDEDAASADVLVVLVSKEPADGDVSLVQLGEDAAGAAARLMTALTLATGRTRTVVVDIGEVAGADERERQRKAVRLVDALCSALA